MTFNNQKWLDQVKEEAIDPERPICDPHHHLFIQREHGTCYFIRSSRMRSPRGHNVISTVYRMQSHVPLRRA